MDIHYTVAELQRRLANLVRRGRIHSIDFEASPPRCRVELEPALVTGWLLWSSGRAGTRSDWEPLTVGEGVLVLSPCGDLAQGVVMPALPNADNPVAGDEHVHSTVYADGTTLKYDRNNKKLTLIIAGGDAQIDCNTLIINADIQHTGRHTQTGDFTQTGHQTVTGNIAATGDVSDGKASLQADRDIYNLHDHAKAVSPPVKKMPS
ncbi:phage baseplate assembly protein V [Marinagarivorans algicola]|uniref:phage baseplate assembly protein V n=1 Tax=Marinagarivorans algicola TaxID=1513270 RepID=UPI0037365A23